VLDTKKIKNKFTTIEQRQARKNMNFPNILHDILMFKHFFATSYNILKVVATGPLCVMRFQ